MRKKYAGVNLVPFSHSVHTCGCQSFDGRGCLKNTVYVKLPKCFLRLTGNLVAILCVRFLVCFYFCQVKSLRSTAKFTRLPSGYLLRSWRVTCCSQMFFFLIFWSPFSGNWNKFLTYFSQWKKVGTFPRWRPSTVHIGLKGFSKAVFHSVRTLVIIFISENLTATLIILNITKPHPKILYYLSFPFDIKHNLVSV